MAFLEKIKQIATGQTLTERKESAVASQIIRGKARATAFREREKQEIRLATAREKAIYDRKIANLNRPRPSISAGGGLNYFREQPRLQSKNVVKYVEVNGKKKKPKKKKFRRVVIRQKSQQQQRFNIISGNGGFRVI